MASSIEHARMAAKEIQSVRDHSLSGRAANRVTPCSKSLSDGSKIWMCSSCSRPSKKGNKAGTPSDPGKGITNLSQNPSCPEDLPVPLAAELRGGLVVRITRIEQRNEEKSVAEEIGRTAG